ncbi:DJ-1/PfpI family protein [Myroides sp. M-43]|uniref:GlxA family transcriptional regulator n=1 Tax=Myroides oncorhynchi TaxID=2893756 RepID=UPI001E2F440E|nr:helix-turn-helix domain-containing protein [Myroides oncorhynchi]MCC9042827.1 DJ-1/PfpI family protein [Myroides oncorhynchi]
MNTTIHHIGFLLLPQTQLLDFAGPSDVFNTANQLITLSSAKTAITYQLHLISGIAEKTIKTSSGISVLCDYTIYDRDIPLDTLLIAGSKADLTNEYDTAVLHWIKGIYSSLQRIGSICIGAFLLGKTGLLNNKRATTHWQFTQTFKDTYPSVRLAYDHFYIKDENIYSSGGITSGIDLALALIGEDSGHALASAVSRYLVVNLKRQNTQELYSSLIPADIELTPLVKKVKLYITERLTKQSVAIIELAELVNMSERNFSRVFKKESGMTPGTFNDCVRIENAKRLLESSDIPVVEIAHMVGYASDNVFRKAFTKLVKVTPMHYRAAFQSTDINSNR